MSDPTPPPSLPTPRPAAIPPDRARIDPAPTRRMDVLPILYLIGFVILAGALAYLWRHPTAPRGEAVQEARVDTLHQELDARQAEAAALAQRVAALTQSVANLEARPVPAVPDVGPLDARLSALEARPPVDLKPLSDQVGALQARPPVDLKPLSDQVAALQARPPVDLKPLSDQVAALQARPPVDLKPLADRLAAQEAKPPVDLKPLSDRLAAQEAKPPVDLGPLNAQVAAQAGASQQLGRQIGALDTRVAAAEAQAKQTASGLAAITDRAQRMARAQSVAVALAAGQPLGDLPGAPPALAKFAHQAPPTDSALRLSFDAAATAAQRASLAPTTDSQSFTERAWTRAQQSLSVRQGDRVLLGDPIAGLVQHARQLLDAGDLGGAVHALDGLSGPAKAAMADWIGQAQSLLDARAAMSSLAAQG